MKYLFFVLTAIALISCGQKYHPVAVTTYAVPKYMRARIGYDSFEVIQVRSLNGDSPLLNFSYPNGFTTADTTKFWGLFGAIYFPANRESQEWIGGLTVMPSGDSINIYMADSSFISVHGGGQTVTLWGKAYHRDTSTKTH